MKIKVLSRSDAEWSGRVDGTPNFARGSKNPSSAIHAPQRPLDLQRAVTAAKITRTLARPFLFACTPGHIDGVYTLARSRSDVALFASASADGELRIWDMPTQRARFHYTALPAAFVRGVTFSRDSQRVLYCTDAKVIHSVDVNLRRDNDDDNNNNGKYVPEGLKTYRCLHGGAPAFISASYHESHFAVAVNACVQVWDENRSAPLSTYDVPGTVDTVHCVRYNPVESHIIASAGADRSVVFFDIRARTPIRRLVLSHRTNDLSWNPIEAMNIAAANDDHNVYSYDMRKLSKNGATFVHKDHTAAVMAVDFSPTGQELVTGGYDKTIRIFQHTAGRSKEVYHTKRMQRVFAVSYSLDGAYVVSASDDGDVRAWKNERSRPIKPLFHAERQKLLTSEKLIERYRHVDDVRKIAMKRHVPSHVKLMQATKSIMKRSQRRKDDSVRRQTLPENRKPHVPDRKSNIVRELE